METKTELANRLQVSRSYIDKIVNELGIKAELVHDPNHSQRLLYPESAAKAIEEVIAVRLGRATTEDENRLQPPTGAHTEADTEPPTVNTDSDKPPITAPEADTAPNSDTGKTASEPATAAPQPPTAPTEQVIALYDRIIAGKDETIAALTAELEAAHHENEMLHQQLRAAIAKSAPARLEAPRQGFFWRLFHRGD